MRVTLSQSWSAMVNVIGVLVEVVRWKVGWWRSVRPRTVLLEDCKGFEKSAWRNGKFVGSNVVTEESNSKERSGIQREREI